MALRVGYVAQQYPQLTQTFITTEIEALRRRGVDIRIASVVGGDRLPHADEVEVISWLAGSVPALVAGATFALRHPARVLRMLRDRRLVPGEFGSGGVKVRTRGLVALAAAWERAGVTAVHAHFAWAGAAAAMGLSRLLAVPWSMTIHANDMYAAERNLAAKLRDADHVVTVCEYNRRLLIDEWGVEADIPIVICGVDDVPAPDPEERSDVDVVAVGRLIEKKGFDVLIRAIGAMPSDERPRRVVIVGEGPLHDALLDLAKAQGVDDVVEFAGAMPHQEVLGLIGRSRVVVAPFRIATDGDRDSMPVVVKEAMVRARAVIGADVAAMDEMLDGETGLLVAPDDPAALAEALGRVLRDDALRESLGAAARRRARSAFLIETSAEAMETVLREVVAARR